jgi:branched-subunit amino acid transport protein
VSTAAITIIGCTAVTFTIKAIGPVALGGRDLPDWFSSIVALMASALLAALVVTSALADGKHLMIGADTAGVAVGGLLHTWEKSIIVCVIAAAVVTAGLRAL